MQDAEIEHLIKMINQIAANLARGIDEEEDVAKVADHLQRFWSPGMRMKLSEHLADNPEALPRISAMAISKAAN